MTSQENAASTLASRIPRVSKPGTAKGLLDNEHPMTARGFYFALMLSVVTVIAMLLLVKLKLLFVLVFVSVLIATSLAGPVRKVQSWGVPRSLSILMFFLLVAVFFGALTWFALPPLVGQFAEAATSLPERAQQFERLQERYQEYANTYPILLDVQDRATSALGDFGTRITAAVVNLPAMVMLGIFVVSSLMTLSFLMLMSWSKIKQSLLRLIHPEHRKLTDHVLTEAGDRMGAYFRAKFIVVTVVAIWMYITLIVLGSPLSLLVAIFAGVCEIIPRIGPLFGRLALVVAVAPLGWKAMLIVFISHTIVDNIKGSWLSPLVEGKQLNIHPLTAFISVIAGGLLMSWMGALIAVPVAASIQVVIEEVVIPWRLRQLELAESLDYAEGPLEIPK